MDIGDRFRQLRQGMGLSQRDLARRAGVTNATISMIEHNKIAGGRISFRQVGNDLRDRPPQVSHETCQPRVDTGRAMLGHEGEEPGTIIRGRIEITVGEARQVLGPDDAYYYDSRVPHRFRNIGKEPRENIGACTQPNF